MSALLERADEFFDMMEYSIIPSVFFEHDAQLVMPLLKNARLTYTSAEYFFMMFIKLNFLQFEPYLKSCDPASDDIEQLRKGLADILEPWLRENVFPGLGTLELDNIDEDDLRKVLNYLKCFINIYNAWSSWK